MSTVGLVRIQEKRSRLFSWAWFRTNSDVFIPHNPDIKEAFPNLVSYTRFV
ncbi:hypothetical protein [Nostoc sp. CCY0012]|uniref:hypothetical protein n=1 Tax=Nostoc sp. CCY0012 TaxID=1056123 RepID=UPI0039C67950